MEGSSFAKRGKEDETSLVLCHPSSTPPFRNHLSIHINLPELLVDMNSFTTKQMEYNSLLYSEFYTLLNPPKLYFGVGGNEEFKFLFEAGFGFEAWGGEAARGAEVSLFGCGEGVYKVAILSFAVGGLEDKAGVLQLIALV